MAKYQSKPEINNGGRLTRLARAGKKPGERAREIRTKEVGLDVAGKIINPDGSRMTPEQVDTALINTYQRAVTGKPGRESKGETAPDDENPVLTQYQLRQAAREWMLKEAGLKFHLGRGQVATEQNIADIIEMTRNGYTMVECAGALDVSTGAVYSYLQRHPEAKKAVEAARLDYAHARVARLYEDIANEPDPQRARLLADVVKWEVSKVLPAYYGDRQPATPAGQGVVFQFNLGAKPVEGTVIEAEQPLSNE
jgi:hypothetical protein